MKRGLVFIPLGVFALIVLVLIAEIRSGDGSALPSPLIGHAFPVPAKPAWLLDSNATTLPNWPDKATLVNVWATWCEHCKREHAFLNWLSTQGVAMAGINYKDDQTQARQWLQRYGNPYQWVLYDPKGSLGLELGVYGAPETFLVDASGIIRAKHIGEMSPKVWRHWQQHYSQWLGDAAHIHADSAP